MRVDNATSALRLAAWPLGALAMLFLALPRVSARPDPPAPIGVQFGSDLQVDGGEFSDPGLGQTEPAIGVNPADPTNLVVGFQDTGNPPNSSLCHASFSADGGVTWSSGVTLPMEQAHDDCADSSLGADPAGNFYYSYMDVGPRPTGYVSDLLVAKSTDGGRSFPAFVVAAKAGPSTSIDKPYLAVDTQSKSRFRGRIYVSYTDFLVGVRVVVSRDGGATWSEPVTVAPFQFDPDFLSPDGSQPVVAPDGTVYVFYAVFSLRFATLNNLSIGFSRSKDGGLTWTPPASVASGLPSPGIFNLKNADPKFGSTLGAGFRASSFPTAAVAPDGTLFVAWIDFPRGACVLFPGSGISPCIDSDVRLSVSRDGGKSWTDPVKVTDETNATDQFVPWIAVHPDGLLSIAWLDKRLDPDGNVNFDAFYTNTYDGVMFLPNERVSTVTSVLGSEEFFGDYIGLAATATRVVPVWNDLRLKRPGVFTAVGTRVP